MSTLGRLWRWLEPGLVYVDPMIYIGYLELTGSIEPPSPEADVVVAAKRHGRPPERQERPHALQVDRS